MFLLVRVLHWTLSRRAGLMETKSVGRLTSELVYSYGVHNTTSSEISIVEAVRVEIENLRIEI